MVRTGSSALVAAAKFARGRVAQTSVRSVAAMAEAREEVLAAVPKVMAPPPMQRKARLCNAWVKSTDLCVSHGSGCYLHTTDGSGPYLDMTSGIAVVSTGHCHPHVSAAIQKQADVVLHAQINNYDHPGLHEFAARLGGYLPEGLDTVFYDSTGTQAIEAAVKLARLHTKRPHILTLRGGFHGRSNLCSTLTTSSSAKMSQYIPAPSGVHATTCPSAFRWGVSEEEAVERALTDLKDLLKSGLRADHIAAFLFEPVLGEGGFIPIPLEYVRRAREMLQPHGVLYISDEIQAGYGRTGAMWGCDHFASEWRPDILVSSKGIASGMPLSVVAAREEVMDAFQPGQHGGTFNGNAVAVAAALATLDVFEAEGLIENSRIQGSLLKSLVAAAASKYAPTCDVRGTGLMVGLECCDAEGKADSRLALYVKTHCRVHSHVLLYQPSGLDGNVIRLMPPLVIGESEVVRCAAAIEAAMRDYRAVCETER